MEARFSNPSLESYTHHRATEFASVATGGNRAKNLPVGLPPRHGSPDQNAARVVRPGALQDSRVVDSRDAIRYGFLTELCPLRLLGFRPSSTRHVARPVDGRRETV